MPIMFNTILRDAGLPLADVRLLRHKHKEAKKGRTPYELWRDNRPQFEWYQRTQNIKNRTKLTAPYWAAFVVNTGGETMFAGLYAVRYRGLLDHASPKPHTDGIDEAGSCDVFDTELQDNLSDLIGKLFIDWGPGKLAWVQYASRHDKPVIELRREFKEPDFPGFINFIQPLSKIEGIPPGWIAALKSSRGVYLLTCPPMRSEKTSRLPSIPFWPDLLQAGGFRCRARESRATCLVLRVSAHAEANRRLSGVPGGHLPEAPCAMELGGQAAGGYGPHLEKARPFR